MSAATLRQAAALMRKRAMEATPGPWDASPHGDITSSHSENPRVCEEVPSWNQLHIASWHPAVAMLVSEWIDMQADHAAGRGDPCESCVDKGLDVARAYLDPDGK